MVQLKTDHLIDKLLLQVQFSSAGVALASDAAVLASQYIIVDPWFLQTDFFVCMLCVSL